MADTFKNNAMQYNHQNDDDILYAVVRSVSKQIRDINNSQWDSHPAIGSLDDYDISAGVASGGLWSGGFPEITKGFYIVQIRKRVGETPDCSDPILAAGKGYWNGKMFVIFLSSQNDTAFKLLVNKAVQNKNTGAVKYYDDDGQNVILTHTPTDGESTITRTPS